MAPSMSKMIPATSFDYFMRLVPEIRFMIWEFAIINPELKPLAHFFGFRKEYFRYLWENMSDDWRDDDYVNRYTEGQWCKGEPSAEDKDYANDSGLYNACPESRSVLLKVWAKHMGFSKEQMHWRLYKAFGYNSEGKPYHLTMYPTRDLICAPNPWDVDRVRSQLDLFNSDKGSVAFIFDPKWATGNYWDQNVLSNGYPLTDNATLAMDRYRDSSNCAFREVIDWMTRKPQDLKLWFIDFDFKPIRDFRMDMVPANRQVFRGRSHMYIEASADDVGEDGIWHYPWPHYNRGIWKFLHCADRYVADKQRSMNQGNANEGFSRALACIPLRWLE